MYSSQIGIIPRLAKLGGPHLSLKGGEALGLRRLCQAVCQVVADDQPRAGRIEEQANVKGDEQGRVAAQQGPPEQLELGGRQRWLQLPGRRRLCTSEAGAIASL